MGPLKQKRKILRAEDEVFRLTLVCFAEACGWLDRVDNTVVEKYVRFLIDTKSSCSHVSGPALVGHANKNQASRPLARLVGFWQLNVWGERPGPAEALRETAALLLTVGLFFDILACTMLFTFLFSSGDRLSGWMILVAFPPGCLLSLAFFVYERQLINQNSSSMKESPSRGFRFLAGLMLRMAVIVVSAVITVAPFELLVFRGPIAERAHQESVRAEALKLLRTIDEINSNRARTGANADRRDKDAVDALEQFIGQLAKSSPGTRVRPQEPIPGEPPDYVYSDNKYNALERLALLMDLIEGLPPKWSPSKNERERLADRYQISDKGMRDDPQAQVIAYSAIGLLLLSIMISITPITFKIIMPPESDAYLWASPTVSERQPIDAAANAPVTRAHKPIART
jgi:hypothetical protein